MKWKVVLAGLVLLGLGLPAAADEYKESELRAIGEGRGLYLKNCASCHGPLVTGDAKAATVAPDLSRIEARDGSFDPVHVGSTIRWGVPAHTGSPSEGVQMPRWGRVLRARHFGNDGKAAVDVYKLVRYLEFVQAPG